MLLALTSNASPNGDRIELCVIAQDCSDYTKPLKVDLLEPTTFSVYYVGPKESIAVKEENGFKVIEPVVPAALFVTPTTPERAGTQAAKVRIKKINETTYQIDYAKDKAGSWLPWNPVEALRM